jgi:hypothetical protein
MCTNAVASGVGCAGAVRVRGECANGRRHVGAVGRTVWSRMVDGVEQRPGELRRAGGEELRVARNTGHSALSHQLVQRK